MNKYSPLFFLILLSCSVLAQDTIVPLENNAIIQNYQEANPNYIWNKKPTKMLAKTGITDTLTLPFNEDFTTTEIYPDSNKWINNAVYINSDFPVLPPSYGVATFDGLNSAGLPYNITTPTSYGIADTLTSQPINLSANFPSDSIYLSFYYQPAGLGDEPESSDSLILQFRRNNPLFVQWVTVWSVGGTSNQGFIQVLVPVKDTAYFHEAFQFRWLNKGSLTGWWDVWHLDYIRMAKNRHANDVLAVDVAIVSKPSSMLKNYRSMPWNQFILNPNGERADSISFIVRNLNNQPILVPDSLRGFDRFENLIHDTSNTLSLFNNDPQVFGFKMYDFNNIGASYVEVRNTCFIQPTSDVNRKNDTVKSIQVFGNYMAYDDGTAEAGYGLNYGQLANGPGKVAYGFTLNTPDTLKAVSLYFNQAGDYVGDKNFTLMIWKSITPNGNDEVLLYKKNIDRPNYGNGLNGFYNIELDTLLIVGGTFYIGWYQSSKYIMNIGFDRNYLVNKTSASNPNLFYNVEGTWVNSQQNGTIMMRPVLGHLNLFPLSVNENKLIPGSSGIYPNPTTGLVHFDNNGHNEIDIEVYDLKGSRVFKLSTFDSQFEVSGLVNGMYFVHFNDKNTGVQTMNKLVLIK